MKNTWHRLWPWILISVGWFVLPNNGLWPDVRELIGGLLMFAAGYEIGWRERGNVPSTEITTATPHGFKVGDKVRFE